MKRKGDLMVTLYVLNFHAFRYFTSEVEAREYAQKKVFVPFYIYPRTVTPEVAAVCLKKLELSR